MSAPSVTRFVYRGHVATWDAAQKVWDIHAGTPAVANWIGCTAGSRQDARDFIDATVRIPTPREAAELHTRTATLLGVDDA